MLRTVIHAGLLDERSEKNTLAIIDVGYETLSPLADYIVSITRADSGELTPGAVKSYPRWSASAWDLVARAISTVLYSTEQPPAPLPVDRRCAYATKLCATLSRYDAVEQSVLLGTAEVRQAGKARGEYVATFTEDILGDRTASFSYGCKRLDVTDLLMRAISCAFGDTRGLGRRPKLCVPTSIRVGTAEMFDVESLIEPARTGFIRHQARRGRETSGLSKTEHYVEFLTS